MYWANFLHIYQPPTQKPSWVKKITEESYRKIFRAITRAKSAKITLNINACLTELLASTGGKDVIEDIRSGAKKGRIEFTESAKYHPFLPLIPKSEIRRQIVLNHETNKKFFGAAYKPAGFFPPEMAYSKKVGDVAAEMGYKWIILDEVAFPDGSSPDYRFAYRMQNNNDFFVHFRERHFSFRILSAQIGTGEALLREMRSHTQPRSYILTAMDGETFGHHRPGLEHLLFDMFKSTEIKTITVSEITKYADDIKPVTPRDSTWATMQKDFERGNPFSRWHDPKNKIQLMQWQLTDLAIRAAGGKRGNARKMLDRALHSDQYWWASARPWWSLEMIERGAKELLDTIYAATSDTQIKDRAKRLYFGIISTGFEWQRNGTVEAISRQEDEEIKQLQEEKEGLYLTQKDYRKMIAVLKKEMRSLAKNEEYDRAALIKKRIAELEAERKKAPYQTLRDATGQAKD